MTLAPYIHAIGRAPGRGCNLTAATEGIYGAHKAHCLAAVADHSDPKKERPPTSAQRTIGRQALS